MLWNADLSSKIDLFGRKKRDAIFSVLVHIEPFPSSTTGREIPEQPQEGQRHNWQQGHAHVPESMCTDKGQWYAARSPKAKNFGGGQIYDSIEESSLHLASLEKTPRRKNFSTQSMLDNEGSIRSFGSQDGQSFITVPENISMGARKKHQIDMDSYHSSSSDNNESDRKKSLPLQNESLFHAIDSKHDSMGTEGEDDSVVSFEFYEETRMQIGEQNGIISFTYDNQDGEVDSEFELDDFSHQCENLKDDESLKDREVNGSATDEFYAMNNSSQTSTNVSDVNHTPAEIRSNPAFELIPTKNQTHKDHKQRELSRTRKACLEVAADAYKSVGIEIPDMILAQINDHWNHLKGKIDMESKAGVPEVKLCSTKTKSSISSTVSSSSRFSSSVKKFQLHESDEIHVAPCQCALRLMGIKERKFPFDPASFSNHDMRAKIKKKSNNGASNTEIAGQAIVNIAGQSERQQKRKRIGSGAGGMVRTASAFASQRDEERRAEGKKKSQPSSPRKMDAAETCKAVHNRAESICFTGLGYHEITLIRNHDKNRIGKIDDLCFDWEAITIRCSDHDELDILVKLLRDSSQATVIPFSSNPKEKLRMKRRSQRRDERRNKSSLNEKKLGDELDTEMLSTKPITSGGEKCGVHHRRIDGSPDEITVPISEEKTKFCSQSSSGEDIDEKLQFPKSAEEKNKPTATQKRISWDFNFNKKEYCELCDLTFTLLTRRHHCRKCERSCCGHCSNLLIVKGCEEKRYCNRCSMDILSKQAEALRGRTRQHYQETSLPGKVHDMCGQLGVGVVGKLPHWKTYLRFDPEMRPAAGRLTVEIIEALALPSVDLVNGNVDPYVRATITGYDRDMRWSLRQWLSSKRYSLCSRFCSATLSPVWRGAGRKGGELLTLPVISTAGAVLRLEVLHYNFLTNSRGKDTVLGYVEIPLSDLPNANLREPGGIAVETSDGKRTTLMFDGYVDRWYRLVQSDELSDNTIMLSKPISSPCSKSTNEGGRSRKVGLESLEEVAKRAQALCIAPVEWFAQAIKLDLPARRPEAIFKDHRSKSMIHVRIKLNASLFGDVLSHSFFPPVHPFPPPPPYDPEILWTRILKVGKELGPYHRIQQYIEKLIKWKLEPRICVKAYFVFAFHLAIFPHLLKIFHVYLFIFLGSQLKEMKIKDMDTNGLQLKCSESFDDAGRNVDEVAVLEAHNQTSGGFGIHDSPSLSELTHKKKGSGSKQVITNPSTPDPNTNSSPNQTKGEESKADEHEEEDTKLNIAISWVARHLGHNKGLEVLQFKLGFLARDLRNINSVWDGTNPLLTRIAMVYLCISFALHFIISQRVLWLFGTFTLYFAHSPFCIRKIRFFFGFWRGIAKVTRRQHLLDAEILNSLQ